MVVARVPGRRGGGGRLCRLGLSGGLECSGALLAVGSGPQVVAVGGALECPAAFVGEAVVVVAEPGGVVDAGGALSAAPDDVVQLGGRVVAVGEGAAAAVADPGGAALGGGEFVVGLADVEHFAVAAEDDGDELGVAASRRAVSALICAPDGRVSQPSRSRPSRVSRSMVMITVRGAPSKLGVW